MKPIDGHEFVIVEALHQYRMRYVVEVPIGKKDWATDTVIMQEAKEFSQESMGEMIISSRVIKEDEILKLCDEDNDYVKTWNDEHKFNTFVTFRKDYNV
jgi:hypothetical protein